MVGYADLCPPPRLPAHPRDPGRPIGSNRYLDDLSHILRALDALIAAATADWLRY
jgi:hypothetical protein